MPLGFLFLKILGDINPQWCLNQINIKSVFNYPGADFSPNWFFAVIFLSLLLLVGEIVSILGEWLINWLFEFPAFWKKGETISSDDFEKITPCGKPFMKHKMLATALTSNGGIGDFSEIHFALSRLLAGAAWLCLLLLFKTAEERSLLLYYVAIIGIPIAVGLIMWCCTKWNCASFIMLLLSLAFIFILSFDYLDLTWLILILVSILLFASCLYRSVANVINCAADTDKQ